MKQLLLIATLAAIAMPAWADGFSYADLNTSARTAKPDANLAAARERVAQTETLRAAFVLDPVRAWKALSPTETQTLYAAFGGERPLGDEALQWFMRGASGGAGADDMTGLYNPLADVWLIMRWQRIGGSLRITDAVFVPGTLVRESEDPTAWTERASPYADALAQSTATARTSFRTLTPDRFFTMVQPLKPAASDAAFVSITTWMASLKPWGEDKARMAQWRKLHKQLAEGKAGETLAALPLQVRASMMPMGALAHADGQALLLISPLAPQVVVTADYGPNGKPDISLINLANVQLSANAATKNTGASQ